MSCKKASIPDGVTGQPRCRCPVHRNTILRQLPDGTVYCPDGGKNQSCIAVLIAAQQSNRRWSMKLGMEVAVDAGK